MPKSNVAKWKPKISSNVKFVKKDDDHNPLSTKKVIESIPDIKNIIEARKAAKKAPDSEQSTASEKTFLRKKCEDLVAQNGMLIKLLAEK